MNVVEILAEGQANFDGRKLIEMPKGERERYRQRARLFIEALRDNVTDGMIEAANNAEYFSIEGIDILYMMDDNKEDFRNVLRAGIGAALNEEKEET